MNEQTLRFLFVAMRKSTISVVTSKSSNYYTTFNANLYIQYRSNVYHRLFSDIQFILTGSVFVESIKEFVIVFCLRKLFVRRTKIFLGQEKKFVSSISFSV